MDIEMTLAFVLIGLGAIAAGGVGLWLPPGDRIAAGFALVVGAGVGVIALAIGTQAVGDPARDHEAVFLVASALGFVATIASLALLHRWGDAGRSDRRFRPRARG